MWTRGVFFLCVLSVLHGAAAAAKCNLEGVTFWHAKGMQTNIVDGKPNPPNFEYLYQVAFCAPTADNGGASGVCTPSTAYVKQWNGEATTCFTATSDSFTVSPDGNTMTSVMQGSPTKTAKVSVACDQSVTGTPEPSMQLDPTSGLPLVTMTATTDGQGHHVTELYEFTFKHAKACGGPGPSPDGKGGKGGKGNKLAIDVGWIIIICLGVVLILYIAIGVGLRIGYWKQRGTDAIPNKDFWVSVPGLWKSGILFILSPCLKKAGYSDI